MYPSLKNVLLFIMCLCVMAHMWWSEDTLKEAVHLFHFVGSGDQAQAVRHGGKCLCWLSHLASSMIHISNNQTTNIQCRSISFVCLFVCLRQGFTG